ncbi:MAG: hypothetical protein ACPLRZ_11515 [Thermovenabulum sp.]|uniref:hypothetical protein n=1 Tax=Thermovenabulum sp. TaxID=3100335 RepID=UPI003C7CE711
MNRRDNRRNNSIKTSIFLFVLLLCIIVHQSSPIYADEGQTNGETVYFNRNDSIFNPNFDPNILKLDENYIGDKSNYKFMPDCVEAIGTINKLIISVYNNDVNTYNEILKNIKDKNSFIEFCKTHYPQTVESTTGTKNKDEITGEEYIDPDWVEVAIDDAQFDVQHSATGKISAGKGIIIVTFTPNDNDESNEKDVKFYFEYTNGHWELMNISIGNADGNPTKTPVGNAHATNVSKRSNGKPPKSNKNIPYDPFVLSMGTWAALQIYKYRKSILKTLKKFFKENKDDLIKETSIALGKELSSKFSKNTLVEKGSQIVLEARPHIFRRIFEGLDKFNKYFDTASNVVDFGELFYLAYKKRSIEYAIRGSLSLAVELGCAYSCGLAGEKFGILIGTLVAGPIGGVIGGVIGNVLFTYIGSEYIAPKVKVIADKALTKTITSIRKAENYLIPKIQTNIQTTNTIVSKTIIKTKTNITSKINSLKSNISKMGQQIKSSISNAKTSFIRNLLGK